VAVKVERSTTNITQKTIKYTLENISVANFRIFVHLWWGTHRHFSLFASHRLYGICSDISAKPYVDFAKRFAYMAFNWTAVWGKPQFDCSHVATNGYHILNSND